MRYKEILEACWKGYQQKGMKKKGDRRVPNCVPVSEQNMEEDLRKWFKEKWVRFGPDGKIRGDCARGSNTEGKPKCLPQSKAHALGKKGRASSAAKKRREDPDPERRGPAKNVATKVREEDNKNFFTGSKFGDDQGNTFSVEKIIAFAKTNPRYFHKDFPLSKIKHDLSWWQGNKERMMNADTSYPLLVIQNDDGHLSVADGLNRMKKAVDVEKKNAIDVYLVPKKDIMQFAEKKAVAEEQLDEKQDACYNKVKSRYKVWPSAYASGALVRCRKVGAKNWGNKSKK